MTFETRKTNLSKKYSLFEDKFYTSEKRLRQWKAFLKQSKINNDIDFKIVMKTIKEYLQPIYKKKKN